MTPSPLLLAALSALFNAAANLSLRHAADGRPLMLELPTPFGRLSDWYIAAVGFYAVAFVAYALALRSLSLPVAYPLIIGMAYLLTVSGSAVLLKEPLSWQTMLGGVLVVGGLSLIVSSPAARTAG